MISVVIVIVLLTLIITYSQKDHLRKNKITIKNSNISKNKKISDLNKTYDLCKKEFLNLDIKKLSDQIIIRENASLKKGSKILVYITLDENKPKSVSKKGEFVVARYSCPPTKQEMRADFSRIINRY